MVLSLYSPQFLNQNAPDPENYEKMNLHHISYKSNLNTWLWIFNYSYIQHILIIAIIDIKLAAQLHYSYQHMQNFVASKMYEPNTQINK